MKVYVLLVESTVDFSDDREIKVFANYKDAKSEFNEEVERAKKDAGDDWIENVSIDVFSTYEDGDYLNNHISVSILERNIK